LEVDGIVGSKTRAVLEAAEPSDTGDAALFLITFQSLYKQEEAAAIVEQLKLLGYSTLMTQQ
jgi:hypothetical protein